MPDPVDAREPGVPGVIADPAGLAGTADTAGLAGTADPGGDISWSVMRPNFDSPAEKTTFQRET